MGAICWQVVHQNSKNSTNCKLPDAIVTVLGSVASRCGPREVAMGSAVGIAATGAWVAASRVGMETTGVALGAMSTTGGADCAGDSVTGAGAHAVNSTASRQRVARSRRRVFINISFREFITGNPYERINASTSLLSVALLNAGSFISQ